MTWYKKYTYIFFFPNYIHLLQQNYAKRTEELALDPLANPVCPLQVSVTGSHGPFYHTSYAS